jgi:nucleoside-diphosphate-sugar epimerase
MEEDLLRTHVNKTVHGVVYFSTCSIYQKEKSPYINHKLHMENIVREIAGSYYIFRLSQVVGAVNNNTLISFLTKQFFRNEDVVIEENAFRHLIDIDDLVRLVKQFLEMGTCANQIINIASAHGISALDIGKKIQEISGSSSRINVVAGGQKAIFEIEALRKNISPFDLIFSKNYSDNVLKKYVPKLMKMLGVL